ncbi:hypothetical protein HOY80DRAFT_1008850 [Tuber brumale]|nr:hypothetical protein HOY80DRAFT_1008850 [Tuber brumale]
MTPLHTSSHPANPIPTSSPSKKKPPTNSIPNLAFHRAFTPRLLSTHPLIPTLTLNSENRVTFPPLPKSIQTSPNHCHLSIPIHLPSQKTMAKKVKSRTIVVRLISMAMTGYFKSLVRPRTHKPLSMIKYDPVVKRRVLFLEQKRGKNR